MSEAAPEYPLNDFQQNPQVHLDRLKKNGLPEILTVDGKPELIVQDAAAYQKMLDELERLQTIEGLKEGLASMRRGEGIPAREAFDAIRRKYSIPEGL